MKRWFTRRTALRLLCAVLCLLFMAQPAFAAEVRYADAASDSLGVFAKAATVAERKAEIRRDWSELRPRYTGSAIYESKPSIKSPYAQGKLKGGYVTDALNALNFVRRLSKVPDVNMYGSLNTACQYGATLQAALNSLSHTPARASGMSDSFYKAAYDNAKTSNLGWRSYRTKNGVKQPVSLADVVFHGWMADADDYNLEHVGHRRWALNYAMQKVGFGQAEYIKGSTMRSFYSMYAHDMSRKTDWNFDVILYPSSQAFPNDIFLGDYPWSIMLNMDTMAAPGSGVTVRLEHVKSGKTWNFSSKSSSAGHFSIDASSNYSHIARSHCISFRPKNVEKYEGTYKVTVKGLKFKNGKAATLSYSVDFFAL